jgi:hypothetical protein
MRKSISIGALIACSAAQAQVQTLSRSELEALFVGKTVTAVRLSDGLKVRSEVNANGFMFSNNSSGGGQKSRWTIDEAGKLCFKAVGGGGDGCRLYARQDGKVMVYDPSDLSTPVGVIEKIE